MQIKNDKVWKTIEECPDYKINNKGIIKKGDTIIESHNRHPRPTNKTPIMLATGEDVRIYYIEDLLFKYFRKRKSIFEYVKGIKRN